MEFDWYGWVILPLAVFVARLIDVSLGTLRIIFTSRGRKHLAPLLGFVEVFIWVSIISEIARSTNNLAAYLGYAAGFATGNYVGMWIEERLALGRVVVRAILPGTQNSLRDELYAHGYGVTAVDGQGAKGPVQLIYTIVDRSNLPQVLHIIRQSHPKAFFTIQELRSVEQGVFPPRAANNQAWQIRRKAK